MGQNVNSQITQVSRLENKSWQTTSKAAFSENLASFFNIAHICRNFTKAFLHLLLVCHFLSAHLSATLFHAESLPDWSQVARLGYQSLLAAAYPPRRRSIYASVYPRTCLNKGFNKRCHFLKTDSCKEKLNSKGKKCHCIW